MYISCMCHTPKISHMYDTYTTLQGPTTELICKTADMHHCSKSQTQQDVTTAPLLPLQRNDVWVVMEMS